jgi:hypothetical protein
MSSEKSRRYEVWNRICDADALWGPFAFLRPAPERRFTHARLLAVTFLFSSFYGMCANVILVWLHHLTHYRVFPLLDLPLALLATSFLCGELTFLPAWNSRARQSARLSTWMAAKGRPPATHADHPRSSSEA